jgi:hypothetical protein
MAAGATTGRHLHLGPQGGPNGPLMDVIGPRGSIAGTKSDEVISWPRQARKGRSSRRSTIRRFITE